jgi:lysine-N-methylase
LIRQAQPIGSRDASGFHCIGAACEDTCCHGLNVSLDKTTYERYRGLPVGHFRSLAEEYVVINTVGGNDNLYGKITMTPSRTCAFFSTDRLCSLQKEFGPEYLSTTCSIYPRVRNEIGTLETSLHLSCPEAARLVLLATRTEKTGQEATPVGYANQDSEADHPTSTPHRYLLEVRSFVIELIEKRAYPLWQRLVLLGLVCDRLDMLSLEEKEEEIPQVLRVYRELLATDVFRGVLNSLRNQPAVRLDTVLRLTDQCVRANANNKRLVDCFQIFLQGIDYSPESRLESDTQHYIEAEDRYYRPFLRTHEYLLENYLIHYVLKNLFPFGRRGSSSYVPQSIFTEYELMTAHYVLVNGLLTGMAGHYKADFNEGHVVKLIQAFSKTVEHSPVLLSDIATYLQGRDPDRIKRIAALLSDASPLSASTTGRQPQSNAQAPPQQQGHFFVGL